ncbi:MAG: threonine synthase [Actinobacteria bacterium]|nr:threonine synthase [Actinomycetota bacterium]
MKYVSTRGDAPVLDFSGALLTGMAIDGGLYVPDSWPSLTADQLARFRTSQYHEVAAEVIGLFVEGSAIEQTDLAQMTEAAYATFRHPEVVPTRQISEDEHLLELFWGPTLSFKDVAMQLLGRLFEHELGRTGRTLTIVAATSGDTGSAAIEACRDRAGIELVMLHPNGRVSEVQRRQMTTVLSPNIHNVGVDGTFDDCQDLVKAMFGDRPFRDEMRLGAVNSINWARVSAQVVYYVVSSVKLSDQYKAKVSYTVPTGNFGNILAANIARTMGAPIDRLVIAANSNDILPRTHESGEMAMDSVVATSSPAMDIQVSSNFERLLFELFERDGKALADAMRAFRSEGVMRLDSAQLVALQDGFGAGHATESEVNDTIAEVYEQCGTVIDPHTAVAVSVGRKNRAESGPMVYVASAHPAKFGDAVEAAIGIEPQLPPHLSDLLDRPEKCEVVDPDLGSMERYVRSVALPSAS